MDGLREMVALFGTCGDSHWRDPVTKELEANGIAYFNPHVAKWAPENAVIEADHLSKDRVLVFVITGETDGFGGLAEIGWAALRVQISGQELFVVIEESPKALDDPANRVRTLVLKHAAKAGVKTYPAIEDMVSDVIAAMKD